MIRPWRMWIADRVHRCCTCDRRIQIGAVVVEDRACVVCIRCAGPVLARLEVHGPDREAHP
jgi:hypothetical protein